MMTRQVRDFGIVGDVRNELRGPSTSKVFVPPRNPEAPLQRHWGHIFLSVHNGFFPVQKSGRLVEELIEINIGKGIHEET